MAAKTSHFRNSSNKHADMASHLKTISSKLAAIAIHLRNHKNAARADHLRNMLKHTCCLLFYEYSQYFNIALFASEHDERVAVGVDHVSLLIL